MENVIHITHNDSDAIGCALLARLVYGKEVETHFCPIGQTPDKIADDVMRKFYASDDSAYMTLIISDISVSSETADELIEMMEDSDNRFTVISYDHHRSNPNIGKTGFYVSEKDCTGTPASAARLMYNRYMLSQQHSLMPVNDTRFNVALNILIDQISRYDTWEWKNHPLPIDNITDLRIAGYKLSQIREVGLNPNVILSEDLVPAMIQIYGIESVYEDLVEYYIHLRDDKMDTDTTGYYPENWDDTYQLYQKLVTKDKEYWLRKARVFQHGEYIVAGVAADNLINSSDVANAIYTAYEDIDIVYLLYPGSLQIGFRTAKDTIDLSRYASRLYHGGGHQKASGSRMTDDDMRDIMMLYWGGEPLYRFEDGKRKITDILQSVEF